MARSKRQPHDDESKRRRPSRPADISDLPDHRALEGVLWQQFHGDPDTPLAKAQALVYRAFDEPDVQRRSQLARDALALWPDCADAYVLLAELASRRKLALELYQQGVAAGERALGADLFQREVGHFWGLLETRPYLRARLGLAHALWTAARRDEAVQHLQDMLRLNPGDNQGVRYTLAGFLLVLDDDAELARLLQEYPDDGTAAWAYTRALLAFRQHGDTAETRGLLAKAKQTNKHVPDYLLGRHPPPAEQPGAYTLGDESEARNYVGSFLAGWKATAGAVAWLRANDAQTQKRTSTAPHAKGPLTFIKKWLKTRLPQENDVWQADCRPMPHWVRIAGDPVRPWLILVTNRSQDLVLAHQMSEAAPSAALLWDTLVQAMQNPAAGEPHRPLTLHVRAQERWQSLRTHIEDIGIDLVLSDELDHVDFLFQDMNAHVGGQPLPGLLDMPGVTPEQVGSFYQAAAAFYRQAPWQQVGYEAALKVECANFQSGPWYAVLMGQSGVTTGLALYENWKALQRLWAGDTGEENARRLVGTSVTFGEEWDLPVADLDAAQKYGWPVARPDAYPAAFRKERGLSLRPPLAWELELLEGCLRAVPDFVNRRRQDDPVREEILVAVASRQLQFAFAWVVE